MTKKVEDKLKPCPYCGPFKNANEREAYKPRLVPWEHGYMVLCGLCTVVVKIQTRFKTQALHTWNRREGKEDNTL